MSREPYHVAWTNTARGDLAKILAYIATDSGKQANKVYHDLKQKTALLKDMPSQGRIVPELEYFGILTYRELISPPWRIMYKTEGNTVFILAVIDGRRNVEDILLNRFIP
ncbi:MAG: type II toxin-antitoxin system RelE/ParE family toxin [Bacillota bacterium]|nr:type II toxin-antitoxin system RelE/ParE family toxin [Bacillota bacterium]MDW7685110.1 type II toxin-antitoxin system RelE/ParE family toxin [Bacillota bacterium]